HDLAGGKSRRGDARDGEAPAVIGPDILERDGYHDRLTLERMSEKKKGTPTSAVMMPMGKTTPGRMDLETTEVAESSSAPAMIEVGRKKRWSSPTSMRATCGPTSPTKPIVPTKLTGTAASSATISMVSSLMARTLTPKLAALSSPSRIAVSAQAWRANSGSAKSSTTRVIQIFSQVALVRLPMVQKTTLCSDCSEARYC